MKQKIIEIDYIPIIFEKSRRAKHLNISVRPHRGVRVAIPEGVPLLIAKKFASSKINWIKKNLNKIKLEKQRHKSITENCNIDKINAKKTLIKRLSYLAGINGFTYNRVFIRNQKTRWGSCSNKNNINLNIKLAKLPEHLTDYVILHELVHTTVKNHSKDFWNELDKFINNAKSLDKELKKYNLNFL